MSNLLASLLSNHSSGRCSSLFNKCTQQFQSNTNKRSSSIQQKLTTTQMIPLVKMVHQINRKIKKLSYFLFCRLQANFKKQQKCLKLIEDQSILQKSSKKQQEKFQQQKIYQQQYLNKNNKKQSRIHSIYAGLHIIRDCLQIIYHKRYKQNLKRCAFKQLCRKYYKKLSLCQIINIYHCAKKKSYSFAFKILMSTERRAITAEIIYTTLNTIVRETTISSFDCLVKLTSDLEDRKMRLKFNNQRQIEENSQREMNKTVRQIYLPKEKNPKVQLEKTQYLNDFSANQGNLKKKCLTIKSQKNTVIQIKHNKPYKDNLSIIHDQGLAYEQPKGYQWMSKPNHLHSQLFSKQLPDFADNYHIFSEGFKTNLSNKKKDSLCLMEFKQSLCDHEKSVSVQKKKDYFIDQKKPFLYIKKQQFKSQYQNIKPSCFRNNDKQFQVHTPLKNFQEMIYDLGEIQNRKMRKSTTHYKNKYKVNVNIPSDFCEQKINITKKNVCQSDKKSYHKKNDIKENIEVHLWNLPKKKQKCSPKYSYLAHTTNLRAEKFKNQTNSWKNLDNHQLITARKMKQQIQNLINIRNRGLGPKLSQFDCQNSSKK